MWPVPATREAFRDRAALWVGVASAASARCGGAFQKTGRIRAWSPPSRQQCAWCCRSVRHEGALYRAVATHRQRDSTRILTNRANAVRLPSQVKSCNIIPICAYTTYWSSFMFIFIRTIYTTSAYSIFFCTKCFTIFKLFSNVSVLRGHNLRAKPVPTTNRMLKILKRTLGSKKQVYAQLIRIHCMSG